MVTNQASDQTKEILSRRYKHSPDVAYESIDGQTVILDLAKGMYFELDKVGTRIWDLLAESADLYEIAHKLLIEFEVEQTRLEADLVRLIADLERSGLVTPA